jgi:hypothetical protein
MKGPDELGEWLPLKLTAPDNTPVYLLPFAVMGVRSQETGSVLMVLGSTTAVVVQETPTAVRNAIVALMQEDDDDEDVEL